MKTTCTNRALTDTKSPLILFDGVCNLCSASVRFVLARDRRAHFRFAALQSETGQRILIQRGLDAKQFDSIVLQSGDALLQKSDALIAIASELGGIWKALAALSRLLPRPARDGLYDFVARHRYRWFGRRDSCALPPATFRDRFLD